MLQYSKLRAAASRAANDHDASSQLNSYSWRNLRIGSKLAVVMLATILTVASFRNHRSFHRRLLGDDETEINFSLWKTVSENWDDPEELGTIDENTSQTYECDDEKNYHGDQDAVSQKPPAMKRLGGPTPASVDELNMLRLDMLDLGGLESYTDLSKLGGCKRATFEGFDPEKEIKRRKLKFTEEQKKELISKVRNTNEMYGKCRHLYMKVTRSSRRTDGINIYETEVSNRPGSGTGRIRIPKQRIQVEKRDDGYYTINFVEAARDNIEKICGGKEPINLPQSFRVKEGALGGEWVLIYDWFKEMKPTFNDINKEIMEITEEDHRISVFQYRRAAQRYFIAEYLFEQSENKQCSSRRSPSGKSDTNTSEMSMTMSDGAFKL